MLRKTLSTFLVILIYSCNQEKNEVIFKREIIPHKFDYFTLTEKNNCLKTLSDSLSNLENDSLKIQYLFV